MDVRKIAIVKWIENHANRNWIWILLTTPVLSIILLKYFLINDFGLSPDSAYYIMGAENIKKGLGYVSVEAGGTTRPIIGWPPLYSILLLVWDKINFFLFFLSGFLIGLTVYVATKDIIPAIITQLLFSTHPMVLKVYATIWSEAPYITLLLAIILFTFLALSRENNRHHLVILTILLMLLVQTRYAGLFIVFALAPIIIPSGLRRIWKVVLLTAPLVSYLLLKFYFYVQGSEAELRRFIFHPPTKKQLTVFVKTFSQLFVYDISGLSTIGWILLIVALLGIVIFYRKPDLTPPEKLLVKISVSFGIVFLVLVFFTMTFLDAYMLPDDRILIIFYTLILPGLSVIMYRALRAGYVFLSLFLLVAGLTGYEQIRNQVSSGYNSPFYRNLQTMKFIRSLPDTAVIFSNGADVIWYITRKPVSFLPRKYLPLERRLNPRYEEQINEMLELIGQRGGYIVYLGPLTWRRYFPDPGEIARYFPAGRVIRLRDGLVIQIFPQERKAMTSRKMGR